MMQFPKDILDEIKKHIEEEKKRIQENLDSLKAQDPFSDPDRLNDNAASDTEANEETSHDRVEAIEKELRRNLQDIEDALTRIKLGKYGTCQNCGKMIDTDRLAVKPTALFCVSCEKRQEK